MPHIDIAPLGFASVLSVLCFSRACTVEISQLEYFMTPLLHILLRSAGLRDMLCAPHIHKIQIEKTLVYCSTMPYVEECRFGQPHNNMVMSPPAINEQRDTRQWPGLNGGRVTGRCPVSYTITNSLKTDRNKRQTNDIRKYSVSRFSLAFFVALAFLC